MISQLTARVRFGAVIHKVIKQYVSMENEHIITNFIEQWQHYKEWNLEYQGAESWYSLNTTGILLLKKFYDSYLNQNLTPVVQENRLLYVKGHKTASAQPDLIATKPDNRVVIVDFKSGKEWTPEKVATEEQLTEYAVAVEYTLQETPPIAVCVCNLVVDTGEVHWIYGERAAAQIEEYKNREIDHLANFPTP